MLQDGRLKGIKIGQQWRFYASEVEKLLEGASCLPEPTLDTPLSSGKLPVHCLQTIQNLFSGMGQIGAVVLDTTGQAITKDSHPAAFCSLLQSTPFGENACRSCRAQFASQTSLTSSWFTCHSGLSYLAEPVSDNNEVLLVLLAGPVLFAPLSPSKLIELAQTHGLPLEHIQTTLQQIPVSSAEHTSLLQTWAKQAATALQSILTERAGLVQRLQQIAEISQLV
jgi:ligand-binding sensor protein